MMLDCPSCGARVPLDACIADRAARETVGRALAAGPVGKLAVAYLGLFRSRKTGALSWPRAARLLGELLDAVDAGEVRRRGRAWAAPPERFREGIGIVLARRDGGHLDLPLRDHAYLYQVIAGLANASEAEEERRREESLRAARRAGRPAPAPPEAAIHASEPHSGPNPGGADELRRAAAGAPAHVARVAERVARRMEGREDG